MTPATFEQTYKRMPFAPLVALGIALGEAIVRLEARLHAAHDAPLAHRA